MKIITAAMVASLPLLSGCAAYLEASREYNAQPNPSARLTIRVPADTLGLVKGKTEQITQGGVSMQVNPQPLIARRALLTADTATRGNCNDSFGCFFYRQSIPYYSFPDHVAFAIRIRNTMRVPLRLDKAIIALRYGERTIPEVAFKESWAELAGQVILPDSELATTFRGPSLSAVGNGAKISFALYDVITAVNAVSEPSRRSAFVWEYIIEKGIQEKSETIDYRCMKIKPGVWCPENNRRDACEVSPQECRSAAIDETPRIDLLPGTLPR